MSILSKFKNNKVIKEDLYTEKETEFISTGCCTLNILFSGKILNGGIPKGRVSMIAADSGLGKTFLAMKTAVNAQKKGMEVIIFDAEKAHSESMAKSLGLDLSKLMIIQQTSLEKITHQFMEITNNLTKEEKENVLFIIDSWNVLVSSKSVSDSSDGKDVLDLSTSKKKNLFSKLLLHSDSTVLICNQVYDVMDAYSPQAIPGGKGAYFASSSIVQGTSKAKNKDSEGEIDGVIITAFARKGRFSRENTKLKYKIDYKGGIDPYYGLLDIALEGGYVIKPSNGFYQRAHIENDKKHREKEIYTKEFWGSILKDTDFEEYIEKSFSYKHNDIVTEDLLPDELDIEKEIQENKLEAGNLPENTEIEEELV